jgi:uridine kinase
METPSTAPESVAHFAVRIQSMLPVLIGIAGGSASGKTTVVRRLVDALGTDAAAVVEHDRYYCDRPDVPAAVRANANYDHPDALDTSLLVANLHGLRAGAPVDAPRYDFTRHARCPGAERIHPRPAILIEGILVLADASLRALLDLKVFVDTPDAVRFARRLERDVRERGRTVESVVRQYTATVQPMHARFVEPSRAYADVIVPGEGPNGDVVSQVLLRIRQVLDGTADRSVTRS